MTTLESGGAPLAESLAATSPDSPEGRETSLTISDIAELEGISAQYAGKLIRILGKAGLVESVRGCKGGYRLARSAGEISVAEILEALGNKMYDPKLCDRFRGDKLFCVHTNDCAVRSLWTSIQLLIDRVLTQTTLRELVSSEKTMAQWLDSHLQHIQTIPVGQIENLTQLDLDPQPPETRPREAATTRKTAR